MKNAPLIAAALASALYLAPHAASAAGQGFECPQRSATDTPRDIKSLIPAGDALDDPSRLNAAVDTLRRQRVGNALIIDNLIGAYCPAIAADAALTDMQKARRVQQFAVRVTRAVYSVESADDVILDVPFKSAVADTINAKAQAAGVSPGTWVAQTVENVLKSGQ